MNDLTPYFVAATKDCMEMQEAVNIVRKNSSGKIWLIGGFVYRNIASIMYGTQKPKVDLDFIVEIPINKFNLPEGWIIQRNKFGNPKFVNGEKMIDYVPLRSIYSIISRDMEPTIYNYLSGTPLTVQSIAYDLQEKKIIGNTGINSLINRIVAVNNLEFAEYAAKKKGTSIRELLQKKAESMNFNTLLPL